MDVYASNFRLASCVIMSDCSLKVGQIRERDIKLPGRSFEYNVSKDTNAAMGVSRSKLLSPESQTQPPMFQTVTDFVLSS
jgi:hypothetical protein